MRRITRKVIYFAQCVISPPTSVLQTSFFSLYNIHKCFISFINYWCYCDKEISIKVKMDSNEDIHLPQIISCSFLGACKNNKEVSACFVYSKYLDSMINLKTTVIAFLYEFFKPNDLLFTIYHKFILNCIC